MLVTTRTSELAGDRGRCKNSHVTRKGKTPGKSAILPAENRGQSRRVEIGAESDLCFIFHVANADASPRYFRTPFRTSPSRATSDSSSCISVHSPELALQRPNVNPSQIDSLSLSLSLFTVSRPFYSRAGAGCPVSRTDS